ncbi:hypothetical protein LZ30DRAFT_694254 [Colletotrichum cereale]|nr:hypothetical protein LZ30DRAFT_694254 [Colletotrichum cereale]
MCQTPRYLHICPCPNSNCPRWDNDPLMAGVLHPGKGHVLWCEVQPQSWDYCDRWFYEQPYEVVLNAFIDPKDYCPDFRWKNMKQTDSICQECLQETVQAKAEKLAKLRSRWDDSRVAVPYQFMPTHFKDANAQNTQAQGPHTNLVQDGVQFGYTGTPDDSITRDNIGHRNAAQGYDQYLSGPSNQITENETREQLVKRIKFLNEQIGSLEALEERPNPPPEDRLRTLGVTNTRNPFGQAGKSGKPAITVNKSIRRITPHGAIGSERAAARSSNNTCRSNATPSGSMGTMSYVQSIWPAERGQQITTSMNETNRMSGTGLPVANPFGLSQNFMPNPGAGNSYSRPPHRYGAIGQGRFDLRRLVNNSEADNSYAPTSNSFGVIGQRRKPAGNGGDSNSENALP